MILNGLRVDGGHETVPVLDFGGWCDQWSPYLRHRRLEIRATIGEFISVRDQFRTARDRGFRTRLIVEPDHHPIVTRLELLDTLKEGFAPAGVHHVTLRLTSSELDSIDGSPTCHNLLRQLGAIDFSVQVLEDRTINRDFLQADVFCERNTAFNFEPRRSRVPDRWGTQQDYAHYPALPGNQTPPDTSEQDQPTFNALVLTTTANCNASCRHCAPSCQPVKAKPIDVPFFASLIQQAASNRDIGNEVALVGGEATIYFEELVQLFDVCGENGMLPRITTNGWWGKNKVRRRKFFKAFRKGGLKCMELSVDTFHQEFIPISAIVNILTEAPDFGISIILRVSVDKANTLSAGLSGIPLSALEGQLVASSPAIPMGRAAEVLNERDRYQTASLSGFCHKALNFTVRYDGVTTPCCVGTEFVPFLHLGNAREVSVDVLVENFHNDFVLQTLTRSGPQHIVRMLPPEIGHAYTEKEYVGVCHLCLELFQDQQVQTYLSDQSRVVANQAARKALDWLALDQQLV